MKLPPEDLAEKNIRAIYTRELVENQKTPLINKVAQAVAQFSGTVAFAILNAAFFALWMILNSTMVKFDPYPFTLLLIVMSIESIFLSTFVLISQNELTKQTELRNKLDLHVNLLTEQESTEMMHVLIEVARKLGVPEEKLKTLQSMAVDTDPEEMLEKIAKVEGECDESPK